MKFIKKHKLFLFLFFVAVLLMCLAGFAVYRMFYPSNDKSVYGDRLAGATEIDKEAIEKIEEEIKATELVTDFNYKLNVVTMKFFIDVKDNVKINKAQELANIINKNLSNDVKGFYDVEIYLTQKTGELEEYPAIGYHSKSTDVFSWVINKAEATNEE